MGSAGAGGGLRLLVSLVAFDLPGPPRGTTNPSMPRGAPSLRLAASEPASLRHNSKPRLPVVGGAQRESEGAGPYHLPPAGGGGGGRGEWSGGVGASGSAPRLWPRPPRPPAPGARAHCAASAPPPLGVRPGSARAEWRRRRPFEALTAAGGARAGKRRQWRAEGRRERGGAASPRRLALCVRAPGGRGRPRLSLCAPGGGQGAARSPRSRRGAPGAARGGVPGGCRAGAGGCAAGGTRVEPPRAGVWR